MRSLLGGQNAVPFLVSVHILAHIHSFQHASHVNAGRQNVVRFTAIKTGLTLKLFFKSIH
jgi:hypothetical protein